MTPEQIEFHRKRFEEYWKREIMDKLHPMFNSNSVELKDEKRSQWEGWIKSIESIEIDIPDDDCFEYSESGITILDSGIRRGTMINSIQSLGLKVKEQK